MDLITLILCAAVTIYMAVYAAKYLLILCEIGKAYKEENYKKFSGEVSGKLEETSEVFQGKMIKICYPEYKFSAGGLVSFYQSPVRHKDIEIGQPAEIFSNDSKTLFWTENDVPLMRKQLLFKISTVSVLLAIMILVNAIL